MKAQHAILFSFLIIGTFLLSTRGVFADENTYLGFDISEGINLNDRRSIVTIPDIIITAKTSVNIEGDLIIGIPVGLQGIFSQDFSHLVVGGTAAKKLSPLSIDNLSLNQKSLKLPLSEGFTAQDNLIISGLQLKIYQEDNGYQPLTLSSRIDGGNFLLNSTNGIRLDIDDKRRYPTSPEAIRGIKLTPKESSNVEISWGQGADLDLSGYELTIMNKADGIKIVDRTFLEKMDTEFLLKEMILGAEYKITISVINSSGLKTDTSFNYIFTKPALEPIKTPEKTISFDAVKDIFTVRYEMLVPEISRQVSLDRTKNMKISELYKLLKESIFFASLSKRTQVFISRLEKNQLKFSIQELTYTDMIRLMSIISIREHLPNIEVLRRPDTSETPFRDRLYLLMLHRLMSKGIIDDTAFLIDPQKGVSYEAFYTILFNFNQKLLGKNK